LLSVLVPYGVRPVLEVFSPGPIRPATASAPQGYSPAQLRTAYGISSLSLGSTVADGTGQTIAVVDACNDPTIVHDVDAFDQQFGVAATGSTLYQQYGAAASFLTVYDQNGHVINPGATSVPVDPSGGWEGEEALDIEWAHAMAPSAKIDLVECANDLFSGVQAAAALPGVSVVSMSWGSQEYQGETSNDGAFATPAGHEGVTFLASTGDQSQGSYPAFSPNVVAVGGTTLRLNANNSIQSETAWSSGSDSWDTQLGTGGGTSAYEREPAYQNGVQTTGFRTTPDVSFDADPATGVAVYNSYDNSSPWMEVGGTSLAAPAWAGVIALVSQARVLSGQTTLNTNQTLTSLYSLSHANFHDITSGSISSGGKTYNAGAGYDEVTGLGSPVVNLMVVAASNVAGSPSITSAANATFTVGQAGTFSITTKALPTASISEIGALPAGITFTANSNGTATLKGTAQDGSGGVYTLTFDASNGVSTDATQTFTLNVNQAPTITSASQATFVVGQSGSFTVTTNAGFPVTTTLSVTGTLPKGITFTANGDGTATLQGTPVASGSYTLSITTSNAASLKTTQTFTLTIDQAPSITSAAAVSFTVGQAGSFTITTKATPIATVSESGTLPAGVTFVANSNGTATLKGTPQAGAGGVYTITLDASNGLSPDANQTFTLTVNQPPAITSAKSTMFTVGQAASFTITTSAGSPTKTTLSVTGSLPGGVTFKDHGDGTATLQGTPVASGNFTLTITASNSASLKATQTFTLTVDQTPIITSAASATFTVGKPGSFTVTTKALPIAAVSESGTLPAGVTFVANSNGTAMLKGMPQAGTGGVYTLSLDAGNGLSPDGVQTFTLTVVQPPAITSVKSTTFTVGQAGSFTVTTSAGYPVTTSLKETGALPSGVTFRNNGDGTATLQGTPIASGNYTITITASNAASLTATQTFTLTIDQTPSITSAANTAFTVGKAGTFSITTKAYPIATLSESGALPAGVTFVPNSNGTATLTGTPQAGAAGVYTLSLDGGNGLSPDAVQTFTLTVNQPPVITSVKSTTFTVGQANTFTFTTSAGYPATTVLSEGGTLPTGVSFTDNGDGTATLHGTPVKAGTYTFTITATNSALLKMTQSFTLIVDPANMTVGEMI